MTMFVEIHAIQSLPPSNINRDETGAPKSAYYGGCNRQRVSSQAWKRAARESFADVIVDAQRATRTKRIVTLLTDRTMALGAQVERADAVARATKVLQLAGIKVKAPRAKKGETPDPEAYESEALVFVSNQQLDALAELAAGSEDVEKKAAKQAADTKNGVSVALFGRMVASAPDLNVDAAVQVAHAISTHKVDMQGDFYTAVDDRKPRDEDAGAGMMGTIEFSSATLYRYAAISLDQLRENLGDAALTVEAVAAFTQSFLTSVPSGKKNSMAADTLPSAVLIMIRDTRPVSLVGAFERPVPASGRGFVAPSVEAMVGRVKGLQESFGLAPLRTWGVGEPDLIETLGTIAEVKPLPAVLEEVRAAVGGAS
ncbi:MAG: type I-E CRISPR-associated protein Cas7/Cse4/CasC [Propioniciclava sp.]